MSDTTTTSDTTILSWLVLLIQALFIIFHTLVCLASIAAVLQESKIWKHPKLPSLNLFGIIKVFLLNVVWMEVCFLGSVMTVIICWAQFDFTLKSSRSWAHGIVENYCGKLIIYLFVTSNVQVNGMENLPKIDDDSNNNNNTIPAPVYIANHHSQIDAAVCYHLQRQWRWIAKSSIIFLPGVGQIMWLSDHIFIDRVKTKSKNTGARNLYIKSNESIQKGVPMMFFPQGTRRLGERLPFKDGAFKIAVENKSPLVPISVYIPLTAWNSSYPFFGNKAEPVVLTVHKPIETKDIVYDKSATSSSSSSSSPPPEVLEPLKKKCFDVIYSVLPDFSKES